MENHFEFDKNRKRVKFCPCGKSNADVKFAPYIGYDEKGYCHSCDKTFLPEFQQEEHWNKPIKWDNASKQKVPKKIDFIPPERFEAFCERGQNHFLQWLSDSRRGKYAFDTPTIQKIVNSYRISNSDKYKGWTLFPYIDIDFRIRDVKAMDYNPNTGKRISVKNGDAKDKCYFIGKIILNNINANTERCFYGEHLLKDNNKLVRIFESEATATYAAPFFPESVCIATGGKNGCKWTENIRTLIGRDILLYPDIDAHYEWLEKAEILRLNKISVKVSDLIKTAALTYAKLKGKEYNDLVKQKFDLRDLLQYTVLNEA